MNNERIREVAEKAIGGRDTPTKIAMCAILEAFGRSLVNEVVEECATKCLVLERSPDNNWWQGCVDCESAIQKLKVSQ